LPVGVIRQRLGEAVLRRIVPGAIPRGRAPLPRPPDGTHTSPCISTHSPPACKSRSCHWHRNKAPTNFRTSKPGFRSGASRSNAAKPELPKATQPSPTAWCRNGNPPTSVPILNLVGRHGLVTSRTKSGSPPALPSGGILSYPKMFSRGSQRRPIDRSLVSGHWPPARFAN